MSYTGPLQGNIAFEHQHGGSRSLDVPSASIIRPQHREHEDEVQAYLEYRAEQDRINEVAHPTGDDTKGDAPRGAPPKDDVRDYSRMNTSRMRKAASRGDKLDRAAKEALVNEVLETTDMDNLRLMQKIKERLDAAGLHLPQVEVRFNNVSATREVMVGNRALPTLPNAARSILEAAVAPLLDLFGKGPSADRRTITMLDDISGVIKPGRLTLLLGPPGSGKSTLLKVLSGQMKDKAVTVRGDILYNGVPPKDFVIEHTAAYIDQVDNHIAEMTVRETMAFSAKMMGQGHGVDPMYPILLQREKELGITPDPKLAELEDHMLNNPNGFNIAVDIYSKLLGLDVCIDTVVGNDLLKGISGGQKKRVTTGEMVVGRLPCLFMDEISTGLDSASTFLISKALKNLCSFMKTTIVVALLQPGPETVDLFDDILLMGKGRVLYHGPRTEVMPFFEGLGFKCPEHKAMADFLQEVTSKIDQPLFIADPKLSGRYISAPEIADAFQGSHQGKARQAELKTPPDVSEIDMMKLAKYKYPLDTWTMNWAVLKREVLLMGRQSAFIIARAIQTVFIAFMMATTFVRYPKDSMADANYYMSVAFFSLIFMMFTGFAEVPFFIQRLPVFYKQRNYNFYPAWIFCIAGAVVRIPDNILMTTLWTLMVYWTVGFTNTAKEFWIFWFILLVMCVWSTAIFRTVAALFRSEVVANAVAAFVAILAINTCGFTIARPDIRGWWIWLYWMNPLAYCVRALLVNEMMNGVDWEQVQAGGSTLGYVAMDTRGYQTQNWWIWVGVAVMLGSSVLFTAVQAWLLAYLDAPKEAGVAVEDDDAEPQHVIKVTQQGGKDAQNGKGDVEGGRPSGTSLSFTPFTLAFRNIKYHVPKPAGKRGEELTLLQGIDGVFRPGVLTALMGASGAGKTTLMDVLAGRKTGGRTEGEMFLNGHPKVHATFARVMGYVEQFDTHSPQATVHEALLFSARMRLAQETGPEVTETFVREVMELVELTPLAHGIVGLPGSSGLSVEQRKRLTIAVELVANPSVVFMDEPTSGLDARAAAIVMRAVRNTVNTGRTVVCTIHQPNLEIFQAFDELLLLKRGGETIFFGNMGPHQTTLIKHFEAVEGVEKFTLGNNPANWMLEVTAPGAEKALGVDFAQIFKESPMAKASQAVIDAECVPAADSQPLSFDQPYAVSKWRQFVLLMEKNLVTYWRSPEYNLVRILITIFCGLFFGSLYYDIGTDRSSVVSVLNIMGSVYSCTLFIGVANCITVQSVVDNERVVYYREKAAGMYSAIPYAIAQSLVEFPYLIVQTIIYSILTYWLIGFEADAAKFFWYFLFLFLLLIVFTLFGIFAVNVTPSLQLATVVLAFFFTAWNLFCGFLQAQPDIPGWWVWMYWSNPLSYIIYGLVATQLGDVHDEFIDIADAGEAPNLVAVSQYVEDTFGYKHSMIGWLVLIVIAFILFFRGVATWALFKLNFQQR